jgi:hypothetical protein
MALLLIRKLTSNALCIRIRKTYGATPDTRSLNTESETRCEPLTDSCRSLEVTTEVLKESRVKVATMLLS